MALTSNSHGVANIEFAAVADPSAEWRYRDRDWNWIKPYLGLFDHVFASDVRPQNRVPDYLLEEGLVSHDSQVRGRALAYEYPPLDWIANETEADKEWERILEDDSFDLGWATSAEIKLAQTGNRVEGKWVYVNEPEISAVTSRLIASYLRHVEEVDAVSLDEFSFNQFKQVFRPTTALSVVLEKFPVCNTTVPFEEIVALRNDEDYWIRRTRLRRWLREVRDWERIEVRQELEYLIQEYKSYMKQQLRTYSLTTIESVLPIALGFIEDVPKLRLKSFAETGFRLFQKTRHLMKAESEAPGREIALVIELERILKE